MTFQHHCDSAALHRQLNDTRPFWLRVNHWLYQVKLRASQPATPTGHQELDNRQAWKKRFQQKSSLLVSTDLTKQNEKI